MTANPPTLLEADRFVVLGRVAVGERGRFVFDGGTRLTVVESGFETLTDPAASMEDNRGGWDWELDELVASLESGS